VHLHYWFVRESIRALLSGMSLSKTLPHYTDFIKSNRDRSVSPLALGIPWIAYGAISRLNEIVTKEMKVFEFGSGGSTRFFAERAAEVHSVEHHEGWYQKVREDLGQFSNLQLVWKPALQIVGSAKEVVLDESQDGLDYSDYAQSITRFPDAYFDLILVDGRARNACIKNSTEKLKPGGFLVVDNSNRNSYKTSLDKLEPWLYDRILGPSHGSKKFTQTSIYKKSDHGI
jgi:hypothetical protein